MAVLRAALVVAAAAVCAPACGQADGSHTSPQTSASTSATTATTVETQDASTGDAVKDTRAWMRALPANVSLAVAPGAVRLLPQSHGQVLLVGLNIEGPTVLQRRWACRFLYPHFRRALPIGDVKAVIFVGLFGRTKWVGSTYGDDTRACADTEVKATA